MVHLVYKDLKDHMDQLDLEVDKAYKDQWVQEVLEYHN
jgi:hypothetical protein